MGRAWDSGPAPNLAQVWGPPSAAPRGAPQCSPWGPMGEDGSPGGQVTLQLSLRVKGEVMRYRQPGTRLLLSLPPSLSSWAGGWTFWTFQYLF